MILFKIIIIVIIKTKKKILMKKRKRGKLFMVDWNKEDNTAFHIEVLSC